MPPNHEIDRETTWHPKGNWLEEHDYLSPNALSILRFLKSPRFESFEALADTIDAGDAQENETELDLMYDNWAELTETVVDLYNMVRRRDERIAALEAEVRESHVTAIEASIATGKGQ